MEQLCGDFTERKAQLGFFLKTCRMLICFHACFICNWLSSVLCGCLWVLYLMTRTLGEFYSGAPGRDVSIYYKSLKLLGAFERGISKTLSILSIAPFALFESLKH